MIYFDHLQTMAETEDKSDPASELLVKCEPEITAEEEIEPDFLSSHITREAVLEDKEGDNGIESECEDEPEEAGHEEDLDDDLLDPDFMPSGKEVIQQCG